MDKNFMHIAVMIALSAAFVVFNTTDKLLVNGNADENMGTADVKIKASETTETDVTSTTDIITSYETSFETETITEIPETSSETLTETTTAMPVAAGAKELGSYSASGFVPLTSSELSSMYTDGIVIVGDSIASGYKVYNRLPENQVMAVGSLGARNIHDFKVTLNGAEYAVKDAISILKPEYICMSMGMNDLNIGTKEDFISNYKANIDELRSVSPDSTFIVMAITPIAADSTHSTNYTIDTYNQALIDMVNEIDYVPIYYVDAAQTLKNEWNALSSTYSGGDGIHLAPTSYDTMLTYLLGALSEIDSSYTDKVNSAEITEAPSEWSPVTEAEIPYYETEQ